MSSRSPSAAPRAQAGTLQLPFPSLDLWRQRLQAVDPNAHLLLACADNSAGTALYVRHGFVEEGRHRDFAFRGGAYVDALSLARVRPGQDAPFSP